MASIDDQIKAIDELEASGVASMSSAGRSVSYRSISELQAVRKRLKEERDGELSVDYIQFDAE